VFAFHDGETAEQRAQLLVVGVGGGALVERTATQLDLERHAHGCQRGVVGRHAGGVCAHLQRTTAVRAQAVRERETLVDLAALQAMPLHGRAGAADIGAVVLVGQWLVAFGAQHV